MNNILIIGAHPDDIEFGCGGSIIKHLELGDNVFVLIMTNGEQGNHPSNREECLNSLSSLGLKELNILFGNFPDGNLIANNITIDFIERYINKLNITKVYTHCLNDRHQDHRNCCNAVSSAARNVPEIFFFQSPSTNVSFEPHYFIELSEDNLKKKIRALNHYQSQIKKGGVDMRFVENLAGVNGKICDVNYAEAFALNHIFRRESNV